MRRKSYAPAAAQEFSQTTGQPGDVFSDCAPQAASKTAKHRQTYADSVSFDALSEDEQTIGAFSQPDELPRKRRGAGRRTGAEPVELVGTGGSTGFGGTTTGGTGVGVGVSTIRVRDRPQRVGTGAADGCVAERVAEL